MTSWDVFLAVNDHLIDIDIFDLWLDGHTAPEACEELEKKPEFNDGSLAWADHDCIQANVDEQYMLFSVFERGMENPAEFRSLNTLQLSGSVLSTLTERYYEFDDDVIRELLGRKLTTKRRKEVEGLGQRRRDLTARSGRRQFENFRRILKSAEEFRKGVSLTSGIQETFLLTANLATRYAAAIFITYNRFETNKKCLNNVPPCDLLACGTLMLHYWSNQDDETLTGRSVETDGPGDLSVDREFLHDLKDLKIMEEKENFELLKKTLYSILRDMTLSVPMQQGIFNTFVKTLSSLIDIATDLNRMRDLKDFFVDVMEQIVNPLTSTSLSPQDVELGLESIGKAVRDSPVFLSVLPIWSRFYEVMSECILTLYGKPN